MVTGVMAQVIMASVTTASAGATSPNTNGSSGVGNVNAAADGTASGIAAQNAAAKGFAVDGAGNVSFPNGVAPGGTVNIAGVSTTGSWSSFSGGGLAPASASPGWGDIKMSIGPG